MHGELAEGACCAVSVDPFSNVLSQSEQSNKVNLLVEIKVRQLTVLALALVCKIL